MQDVYVQSAILIDLEDLTERPTRTILTQGAWFFAQIGTYTSASPLVINAGVKQKISFHPSQYSFTAGRGFTMNYDLVNDKFAPQNADACFLVNFRYKVRPTSQSGYLDVSLESPTVSFNPILVATAPFNKQAGEETFQGFTEMMFISQAVVDNGLEAFMKPTGTDIQVYDISFMISNQYVV